MTHMTSDLCWGIRALRVLEASGAFRRLLHHVLHPVARRGRLGANTHVDGLVAWQLRRASASSQACTQVGNSPRRTRARIADLGFQGLSTDSQPDGLKDYIPISIGSWIPPRLGPARPSCQPQLLHATGPALGRLGLIGQRLSQNGVSPSEDVLPLICVFLRAQHPLSPAMCIVTHLLEQPTCCPTPNNELSDPICTPLQKVAGSQPALSHKNASQIRKPKTSDQTGATSSPMMLNTLVPGACAL